MHELDRTKSPKMLKRPTALLLSPGLKFPSQLTVPLISIHDQRRKEGKRERGKERETGEGDGGERGYFRCL